jgi:nitrous oxidase accessory protein NosD
LQDAIDAAAPGAVLNLSTCTFEGTAKVDKALTLIGGTLTSPSENRLAITLQILADDVTIEGWTFTGGGNVISIFGRSNVRLSNNSFRDHTASPIMMWGGVRNIEISGNSIVHTKTLRASLIGGRGSEGSNPCPVTGRNVTIRNNYGDQGSGGERGTGWFGIELKCFEDVLIEGNTLKGGRALVSLPDSNRVTVRNNTLDLTGSAHWGVEIPKAHNVTIEHNTVFGDGPQTDTAFSANSGSVSMTIRYNKVSDVRTLVDDPLNSVVTDNCIINVKNISEYGNPESSQMERNAVC